MSETTLRSVLDTLPKGRLEELGRHFSVGFNDTATHAFRLHDSKQVRLRQLVARMGRDELLRACERHGLKAKERSRTALAAKLLEASGAAESVPPPGIFGGRDFKRHAPLKGDIVQVRQRQYLVEGVTPPPQPKNATGARVMQPETKGLGQIKALEPPCYFAAYLHALRWNSVIATRTDLFQSPFRAGIKLLNHQLTPLKKALELPRAKKEAELGLGAKQKGKKVAAASKNKAAASGGVGTGKGGAGDASKKKASKKGAPPEGQGSLF